MTQTNGLDVLIAWCMFAVLLGVLLYLIVRGHANVKTEAHRQEPDDDDNDSDQAG